MSHIDEALRRAEAFQAGRDGMSDIPMPPPPVSRFTLDEYPRETPVPPAPERPLPPVPERLAYPAEYALTLPEAISEAEEEYLTEAEFAARLEQTALASAPAFPSQTPPAPPVPAPVEAASPPETAAYIPLAGTALPVAGAKRAPRRNGSGRQSARAQGAWQGKLVADGPGLVSVEQYRRLAAALHDVQVERGVKTVMITSTVPGEGKTLTVANLGLTLSDSYARRVLLIDADLRWPSLHHVFGTPNTAGLADVLKGTLGDIPFQTVSSSLSVLPSGTPGPNPLAGLTSERMGSVLEECARQFDWVILDTPPVGLLPDAQLLARLTRSVVFVINAGATPSDLVERAVAELGPDSVIGTVLNRVEERTVPEVGYYTQYAGARSAPAASEV